MSKEILQKFLKKFKENKRTALIVLIGLMGITFIALSEIKTDSPKSTHDIQAEEQVTNQTDYISDMESKLTDLLSSIENAGEVKVMITLKSSTEDVYAVNENIKNGEKNSDYSNTYVIIENKNEKEGIKLKVLEPTVQGVAVVCSGGDNPAVINQITETVTTVFGIGSNKVSVSKMK